MWDVVPKEGGVPPDGGLVHDAPDPMDHEHDVVDVRKAIRCITKLLVAAEDSVTWNKKNKAATKLKMKPSKLCLVEKLIKY